jgi:hypothetical protein
MEETQPACGQHHPKAGDKDGIKGLKGESPLASILLLYAMI